MPGLHDMPVDRPAPPDLVSTVGALQSLLLASPTLDAFLTDVARLAADVVRPRGSCGITVRRDGRPLTVAGSDVRAGQLDEVQYGAGEGPSLETLATGAVLHVPDLTADPRWERYRPHALAHGVRCSVSYPLDVDGRTVGALNLYGFAVDAFDADTRQHAETFAVQAAAALALVLRTIGLAEDGAQLEQALTSRSIIDQAIGILMAQQRCTADQAFALLRMHSQNNNRKLRGIAAELIARVSGRPPGPPHGFGRQRPTG